jgi:ribonucleoside-diphosphate reductase alpha chain
MFSFEQAYDASLEYFDGDELAATVFVTKYALSDTSLNYYEKTPDDMHQRMAKEFYRIEKNYPNPMPENEIYELFKEFRYVIPQGSPMAGIGNTFQTQSLSNCFVIESPHDSYGGILKADQELVQIAKRRGGIGFDLSTIRPKGLSTANAARTTDGIEVFMDRFSNSCREVAQGGRRGALMLTISVHHPQIRDFIKIKEDLTRITGANVSIRLTDEFLHAVEEEEEFELRFPVDSDKPIMSENVSACGLWDEIIKSAHATAEPGLLFWDSAKRLTPSDIYEDQGFGSVSTNPCGEIILSPYDSCRLMLINLFSFVKHPFKKKSTFDFKSFSQIVQKTQRLMDDMVDLEIEQIDKIIEKIESDPEPDEVKKIEKTLWSKIRHTAQAGRRTGLGVTAVGDTLAALNLRYGSDDSVKTIEEIYKTLAVNAYRSSSILAKERGAFPVHDFKKETYHPFLRRIWHEDPELLHMNAKYGRRNIALTTTAPAGSVSTLTQTTSGIEPAYLLNYKRRRKITQNDQDSRIDFIDDMGDEWQEYQVFHHGFKKWMEVSGETDVEASPYFKSTSSDIDWIAKIKVQAAAQKWICHAISNTTNVPAETNIETVKQIYMEGWKSGCKGVTVYREGSRDGVLLSNTDITRKTPEEERENGSILYHDAPRRPQEMPCHIHHASIKGEAWTILVGLMNGRPYEVLGGLQEYVEIPKKYTEGVIVKHTRKTMNSKYDLRFGEAGDEIVIKDVVSVFDNPNHAGFTRILSLSLRHGVPINYIVEQLQKDKDADLFSFAKVNARVIKKYIADGTKPGNGTLTHECETPDQCNVVYQEGCATCLTCGYAKCG